jgi:protoporphyrinogen/coproporphyrinogen III oxidase
VRADAVILAVPAPAAARLLRSHSLQAGAELSEIETTSVAVVTMLYRADDLPGGDLPEGSGYLVPPSEHRPVKAATFASHKWQWLGDACADRGLAAVRASIGHADDVESLQRDDDDLVRLAAQDLAFVARLGRALPIASRVSRWGGGLPRYAVGHVDRAARITSAIDEVPGLAICGAEFDGVGVPACIARADLAATRVSRSLDADGQWRHG